MAKVNIITIQNSSEGALGPGVSRDDLYIDGGSDPIIFINNPADSIGANTWKWEFLSWPKTSYNETAPVNYGVDSDTFIFSPTNIGTYIIRLTINDIIKGTIGAAIKTPTLGFRIMGEKETNEFPGGVGYQLIYLLASFAWWVEYWAGGGGEG